MSTNSITIKPNNHRIHPCEDSKKIELLNKLIAQESSSNIVVVCLSNSSTLKESLENKSVTVVEDKELYKDKETTYEVVISFDVPDKAIVYMARVSKATVKALTISNQKEQKSLYQIEMLLGRAIKQEIVEGFEYEVKKETFSNDKGGKKLTKEQIKDVAKKRYEAKTQEKPKKEFKKEYKKSDSDDKWAKKKKAPNKFLGKDENGKAIFSGKSGERNHRYDGTPRDKYDAPQKVGRRINVKLNRDSKDSN